MITTRTIANIKKVILPSENSRYLVIICFNTKEKPSHRSYACDLPNINPIFDGSDHLIAGDERLKPTVINAIFTLFRSHDIRKWWTKGWFGYRQEHIFAECIFEDELYYSNASFAKEEREAFREIVRVLAKLYDWDMEDRSIGQK